MPKMTCPACQKSLNVPDGAAGRSARCPKCEHRFRLPTPPAPDEPDELAALDLPDDMPSAPARRTGRSVRTPTRSGARIAVVGVVVAVLGVGAGAIWLASSGTPKPESASQKADEKNGTTQPAKGDTPAPAKDERAERDRDYMMVLDTLLELDGLANGKKFWLGVSAQPGFSDLRGGQASLSVARAFDPALKATESSSVELRKLFTKWHGQDSKTWRPEFVKRHPERDLVNDEIAVVVRKLCEKRQLAISEHLVAQHGAIAKELFKKADTDPVLNAKLARDGEKIVDDEWHDYRMKYLGKQGPLLVDEVRTAVKKMDTVVRLKTKVEAAAPRADR